MFVKGSADRGLWHFIKAMNGGVRTACGKVFPIGTETTDAVELSHLCWACRKLALASGDGQG